MQIGSIDLRVAADNHFSADMTWHRIDRGQLVCRVLRLEAGRDPCCIDQRSGKESTRQEKQAASVCPSMDGHLHTEELPRLYLPISRRGLWTEVE